MQYWPFHCATSDWPKLLLGIVVVCVRPALKNWKWKAKQETGCWQPKKRQSKWRRESAVSPSLMSLSYLLKDHSHTKWPPQTSFLEDHLFFCGFYSSVWIPPPLPLWFSKQILFDKDLRTTHVHTRTHTDTHTPLSRRALSPRTCRPCVCMHVLWCGWAHRGSDGQREERRERGIVFVFLPRDAEVSLKDRGLRDFLQGF